MTPNDRRLDAAFRAVAATGLQEAPMAVEAALRREFRQRRRWRRIKMGVSLAGLTAAAAAGVVALMLSRPSEIPAPSPLVARIDVPVTDVPARPAARKQVRRQRSKPQAAEVATSFYSLPEAATMTPLEYGSVVRVQLPRSAMRAVGLPVNQDRVFERIQADVLLGQDGLARAIRFIQ